MRAASLVGSRKCPDPTSGSDRELDFFPRTNLISRLLTWRHIASAGRGIGSPSAGFGAGLQNVPSPIITTTTQRQVPPLEPIKADTVRERLPVIQLPGITETLKDFAPSQANQPPVTLPGPVAENAPTVLPPKTVLFNTIGQEISPDKKDQVPLLNIYARRADQIGLSHRIPGIAHLGDLLAPPGWKLGDEPINEAEAQRIFATSRSQAKDMLNQSMSEASHLSSADQAKYGAEKDERYQTQRAIDEYLLVERVKLHGFWQERKNRQFQRMHSQPQQHRQVDPKPANRIPPLQPPTETSMVTYNRNQQSLVPASPHLYAPSPPLTGGTLNARINFMQQSMVDVLFDCKML